MYYILTLNDKKILSKLYEYFSFIGVLNKVRMSRRKLKHNFFSNTLTLIYRDFDES